MSAEQPEQTPSLDPQQRELQARLTIALREHFQKTGIKEPQYLKTIVSQLAHEYLCIANGSPGDHLLQSMSYPQLNRDFLKILQQTLRELATTLPTTPVQTQLVGQRIEFTNLRINSKLLLWCQKTYQYSCRADLVLALMNNKTNQN